MSLTASDWHAHPHLVDRYVAGRLDAVAAASVEAHVLHCAACRDAVAARAPRPRLDALWGEVVDRLDAPRVGAVERCLRRLGLPEGDARLAVCAPALRRSWLLALLLVLLFCLLASGSERTGPDLFLLLAPVMPSLAVGLAYGPWVDPTYETGLSAPYSSARLVVVRTAVVLAGTVVTVALAGVVLPGQGTAVLWLVPSAALVAATLALSAWLPMTWAAASLGATWLLVAGSSWRSRGSLETVLGPAGQLSALALLVVAAVAVVAGRRVHAYDVRRFP